MRYKRFIDYLKAIHRGETGAITTGDAVVAIEVLALAVGVDKSSGDETVNNSSTLQNDDDLLFPIGTTGTWLFEFTIWFHGAANADIKFAITVPANALLCWSHMVVTDDSVSVVASTAVVASGTPKVMSCVGAGEGNAQMMIIRGWVKSIDTAGNVQLQWAQTTPQESNTIVMAESHLMAHKEQ